MVPAYGMVFSIQNPSTGNGKIPGCSFILSVDSQGRAPCAGRIGLPSKGFTVDPKAAGRHAYKAQIQLQLLDNWPGMLLLAWGILQ